MKSLKSTKFGKGKYCTKGYFDYIWTTLKNKITQFFKHTLDNNLINERNSEVTIQYIIHKFLRTSKEKDYPNVIHNLLDVEEK